MHGDALPGPWCAPDTQAASKPVRNQWLHSRETNSEEPLKHF
jgi:hypothetical protein